LVITCAALGLLASVSRREHEAEEVKVTEPAASAPKDPWDLTSTDLAGAL
jgi:hypothetical protein